MTACMLYITAEDRAEALKVGRALVEARLAACANVFDGVTSVFWWEGKVQDEPECSLVCKTREDLVEAAVAKVKEVHSYDVPCVVAVPIKDGNPDFLAWIEDETG